MVQTLRVQPVVVSSGECDPPSSDCLVVQDSPWCEIRNTHASRRHVKTLLESKDKKKYDVACSVKGRNEPSSLRWVRGQGCSLVVAACGGSVGGAVAGLPFQPRQYGCCY